MTEIGCPECGQPFSVNDTSSPVGDRASCPHCGHQFAVAEGEDLLAETAVLHKEPAQRGAMLDIALVGHLRVSGSMSLEAPSALRPGRTVVGREDADIVAVDKTLSARHFEIDNRNGEFFIRDLGSTNGTSVDGHPLTGTAKLANGARIKAGETTFVFRTLETIPWSAAE